VKTFTGFDAFSFQQVLERVLQYLAFQWFCFTFVEILLRGKNVQRTSTPP
jgi:hypothetical protein